MTEFETSELMEDANGKPAVTRARTPERPPSSSVDLTPDAVCRCEDEAQRRYSVNVGLGPQWWCYHCALSTNPEPKGISVGRRETRIEADRRVKAKLDAGGFD